MIARRLTLAAASLGLALLLAPAPSFALTSLQQAIMQTKQAIAAGENKHGASLVQHADNAIDKAMMAQRQKADPDVKISIRHLRKAIKTAKGTWSLRRIAVAVKHAETALSHLETAQAGR